MNSTQKVVKPILMASVRVNCHAVPGVWQYEALAFKPGLVMRWFRDGFCQEEKRKAKEIGDDPYNLMNQATRENPCRMLRHDVLFQ
ncbi:MAG: hypothetical protein ACLVCH_09115 [Roseburia inulinivorans]